MTDTHGVIESAFWTDQARADAREWFREREGAGLDEFGAWAERYEYTNVLGSGFGWKPGDPVTPRLQGALDDAYVGLMAARDDEIRRRRSRAA